MAYADEVAGIDRAAQADLGGVPVTYAPELGAPVDVTPTGAPLTGIFDPQYVLATGDAEAGVEARGPVVFLRLEDLPTDPEEDNPTLTIGGINYIVLENRPDGMGGITLALRKVG